MTEDLDDYFVVIITGENEKSDDKDGEIKFIGPVDEYSFHIDCLLDYAIVRYPNIKVFKQMNDRFRPIDPICFLTWLNSIVYLNVSDKRFGNYGILYMPDEISEKQKKSLLEFARKYSNKDVCISYDLDYDDGVVSATDFKCDGSKKFYDQLICYLQEKEKKPKL